MSARTPLLMTSRRARTLATLALLGALATLTVLIALAPSRALAQTSQTSQTTTPDVRQVQRWALQAHGMRGPLDVWSRRARWSALLPEVEVRATWLDRRDDALVFREDHARDDSGALLRSGTRQDMREDTERRAMYVVRLRLDLSRVVFDPRELQAARLAHERARQREVLREAVIQAYFKRRALQLDLRALPASELTLRARLQLQLELHTARLDALTGGRFSAATRRGRRAATRRVTRTPRATHPSQLNTMKTQERRGLHARKRPQAYTKTSK